MTVMTKSPAHWEQPASDKASAAAEQRQLRPGKSDIPTPRDMDFHKLAKDKLGVGFSCNANDTLVRGDNPAAGQYRNPPEHKYKPTDTFAAPGPSRAQTQNRPANQRKK